MLGFPGTHVRQPQPTSTKPRHTQPDPCTSEQSRPQCIPAQWRSRHGHCGETNRTSRRSAMSYHTLKPKSAKDWTTCLRMQITDSFHARAMTKLQKTTMIEQIKHQDRLASCWLGPLGLTLLQFLHLKTLENNSWNYDNSLSQNNRREFVEWQKCGQLTCRVYFFAHDVMITRMHIFNPLGKTLSWKWPCPL